MEPMHSPTPEEGVHLASYSKGDHLQLSIEGVVTTPWIEDASHVVMCVTMGILLILMI